MYDVIVLGGGHAGIEAALASARTNQKTLMVVGNVKRIGNMPCNPSFGGPAKGILIREIDALGGEMGKALDRTLLQLKMLNSSKGPAVRALRAQADKTTYPKYMYDLAFSTPNLDVLEDYITELIYDSNTVKGVICNNKRYESKAVIITSGTYLDSYILCGAEKWQSGPDNEPTTSRLSIDLKRHGIDLIRLKTGTPQRIQSDTIDYSAMTPQYGDTEANRFSEETEDIIPLDKQVVVYLTYTTPKTHEIIKNNIKKSSLYSGLVKGVGPRYCPSIEDKIVRFSDKPRHQIFVEPEGQQIPEMYPQGFSTSLPHDIQEEMVHSLPGMSKAKITKYAYAIEYDAIDPQQLKSTLECRKLKNLYFAGQVNGTSGYEEAGCQGLIAGINASLKLRGMEEIVLRRDEAYIGVLIDDLITKGVTDPYRMLTSRAEFRLMLRHDNSEERLLKYGHYAGLVNDDRYNKFLKKQEKLDIVKAQLQEITITPKIEINKYLKDNQKNAINDKICAYNLLKRPEIDLSDIEKLYNIKLDIDKFEKYRLEVAIKYEGYIKKEMRNAKKLQAMESMKIPDDIDYDSIANIALEAKDKLKKVHPATISQASRISGVNPSDISILLVYIDSQRKRK
ncbi:MAG: tRNA uridine-5-carboxymethylaminomethyl(34) synthesis enzyme MnmG [Bacilli bacterium]